LVKRKEVENLQNLLNSTMEMWGAMVGSIVAEVVRKYGNEGEEAGDEGFLRHWQVAG